MSCILVIDDVIENTKARTTALEQWGYEALTAQDGRQAVVAARAESPQAILLSMTTREMDSIEICRMLKRDPQIETIPVILVTEDGPNEDIVAGLDAGADDYIIEPLDAETLASRICSALNVHQQSDAMTLVPTKPARQESAEPVRQTHLEEDLKDYAAALEAANRTLEKAWASADRANRAKSDFLAQMSHEIRTPMTAVLGFSDVLLRRLKDVEDRAAVHTIKRNGGYLLRLIDEILDLSKIEAERLVVEKIACSPVDVVEEALSLMRVQAEEKGLLLEAMYEGTIPETIRSDPTRLHQILGNLISNAVKFTNTGSVRLVTRFLPGKSEGMGRLQFDVSDTGVGIDAEQVARLFEPFTQGDASTARKLGGTGLGLTISKRLANIMRGDLTVRSMPDKGSTFSLIVPAGRLDGVAMIDPSSTPANTSGLAPPLPDDPNVRLDCRVLLAEDGPDTQRLIALVLRSAGADVTPAQNGQSAYQKAIKAWQEHEPFDVILMDMQMPLVSGYEATRRLRSEGYSGRIIALTASAMVDDEQRCRQAGCDGYVSKPIHWTNLLTMIDRFTKRTLASTRISPHGELDVDPCLAADR